MVQAGIKKRDHFIDKERIDLIRQRIKIKRAKVKYLQSSADCKNKSIIVRGLRAVSDFEYGADGSMNSVLIQI